MNFTDWPLRAWVFMGIAMLAAGCGGEGESEDEPETEATTCVYDFTAQSL